MLFYELSVTINNATCNMSLGLWQPLPSCQEFLFFCRLEDRFQIQHFPALSVTSLYPFAPAE